MGKNILFIMLFTALISSLTFGQSIKVGVGGGYTALTGDNSFTAEDALNLNSGIHYGGKILVSLPVLPIQFAANIYYNPLSNEYTEPITNTTIKTETSFLSIGLGAEFTLIPGPIQPYLAGELLYTSFGEATVNDFSASEAESKTGLGLGAGLYFKLLPVINLDFSAHYNMNTLLSSGDALNSTHVRLNVLFNIL
ncbi:MAG: outer membrane beta-barrel protein [Bacteroidetes bacterium]|nr:outer membrane beta-barrel protein [Bacteroidota bacterium]MBU1115405.1 outer membrane beta-barrel protein [Bacteroidota bacterium]MBU1797926.1 outer membrane beta-barrel protein [Bacteroidota bacterium]